MNPYLEESMKSFGNLVYLHQYSLIGFRACRVNAKGEESRDLFEPFTWKVRVVFALPPEGPLPVLTLPQEDKRRPKEAVVEEQHHELWVALYLVADRVARAIAEARAKA